MDTASLAEIWDRLSAAAASGPARVERRMVNRLRWDVPTFAEAPLIRPDDAAGYDAVFYGIGHEGFLCRDPRSYLPPHAGPAPNEDVYTRTGGYAGPAGIRRGSIFYSFDHTGGRMLDRGGLTIADRIAVADAGDARIGEEPAERLLEWVPDEVAKIVSAGAVPMVLGGDHFTPAFSLEGLWRARPQKVGILCFDGHLDLSWGPVGWEGSQWAYAMRLGILDPRNLAIIGVRGVRNTMLWESLCHELGIAYYTVEEVDRRGIAAVTADAMERVLDGPESLYLSIDVDALDPTAVPAQRHPEAGGLTVREVLSSIRQALTPDVTLAGCDFVDLAPQYDHQNHGCVGAARILLEVLAALAEQRGTGAPA